MAAENIGSIYNTKIPGLGDPADIQEALKLYHYGSLEYDTANTDPTQIPTPSIAFHLNDIQDQLDVLDVRRTAGKYLSTAPTGVYDGYVWVNSSSAGIADTVYSTAFYTTTAPTEGLTNGIIWIDKDSTYKTMYVWDGVGNEWVESSVSPDMTVVTTKGDIIVGDTAGEMTRLPVGSNGYYLKADSTQSSGLKWEQLPQVEFEIGLVMGIY